MDVDGRVALERLIEERGEEYAGLSRLLGRNPAYVQQFIKRGTPRRLSEEDRRTLAGYFGVPEEVLGGRSSAPAPDDRLVSVPRLDVGAAAGAGAMPGAERVQSVFGFDRAWLRRIAASDPAKLSIIRVEGDSMAPTLSDGDEILVDGGDTAERLRDGIYVLRVEEALLVKRVSVDSATRQLSVRSDNPAYPALPEGSSNRVSIVGRVVWAGRRIG